MTDNEFITATKALIDDLKAISTSNGLGGDGNEFKIILQVFLYKFLNDKFAYETKQAEPALAEAKNWDIAINNLPDEKFTELLFTLPETSAQLQKEHLLSNLYNRSNESDFYKTFDETLINLGEQNADLFSIKTDSGQKANMFEGISKFIIDENNKNNFCRAVVNKLVNFSFEKMFSQKYDFFSAIFEYLIKDYNKDGGGVYAEYYTPQSVARILSAIIVEGSPQNVDCYDPAAGSGTLLMGVAHAIGEEKCNIYSQDISQKSSNMLRLNLVLNNLTTSIHNIIQGNTILKPFHRNNDGTIKKFDYIVSNPPFNTNFSDYRNDLDTEINKTRFFAGIPNIPPKKKEKMPIYLLFIQHILFSLKDKGKAAIVVPTGFVTAQNDIENKIRAHLIDNKILKGAICMPPNIFATTGTNVSVLFIDKENTDDTVILVDASKLGEKVKEGKNQKTLLSRQEELQIINAFKNKENIDDFCVAVSYEDIKEKNYSFSAGQYFDVKLEYVDITEQEFQDKLQTMQNNLTSYFNEAKQLETKILEQLGKLKYEKN